MSFTIENAEKLLTLLTENGLSVGSIDELRNLLVGLQEEDPAQRKEELAHKERFQECQQAHAERLRNLEHSERLRALELGHPLPDPGEMARTRSTIRAAACIGILVPLVLTAAAVGLSSIVLLLIVSPRHILLFGVTADLQAALIAMVWGVSGLITLVTVLACLWTARRASQWSPPERRLKPMRQAVLEDRPSVAVEQTPKLEQMMKDQAPGII